MGTDHRMVPAIKQTLSMLGQAREALLFAQCPAAVAKVRQAIKSTEGTLRTVKRRVQSKQVVSRSGVHPIARPWRGLGNPLAKERNNQRAPLGELVGAVVVSWGMW